MNSLYPIFLRLDKLRILIVGAGAVGYEKLNFLLKSSPDANVIILAEWCSPQVEQLLLQHTERLSFVAKNFENQDVQGFDLVISATNIKEVNQQVYVAAKRAKILVNVADTPELCDFYLGAIVTKGNLKIAISTNGKSPTFAKRLRQLIEDTLSDEVEESLELLHRLRERLGNDFETKLRQLNTLTEGLLYHPKNENKASLN